MPTEYEKAGVELELDTSQFEDGYDQVISQAGDLQSALDDLSGEVDITFNVDDAILPFDDIPEETETEYTVNESDEAKQAFEDIHFMALKDKIETVWNFVGNVWDLAGKLNETFVSPLLDIDDAVARINAQTGGTGIADMDQFIRDIQAADLGTSVDQIADVVIAAKQLGAPIDEATRATLTFTHTWTEENPEEVLKTLNTLVSTGLVPNLQAAADLMTVAFQQSVNKGNDALAVVQANAQSWADMGLDGTQALSAINSLVDSGFDSATDAAKAIQTLDDALTTAAANADSPQAEALKSLGLENPKDSGQAMGADFIDGFAGAFTNLPTDQQDLVSGVLFGKGGKKFTGALAGLTTQGGPFADVVGAASDAATEIDNSLRGAIDDFVLAINTSIKDLLTSDKIDLDGFIERLKKGFQTAVGVLSNGGTIGDALEIGFNIQGFDTTVANLERIFGNFEIILLQAIMAVQRLQGLDTTDIGNQITNLAKGQLTFDLQVANADEIPTIIDQAVSRGVSAGDLGASFRTALDESIAKGDFGTAQTIMDGLLKSSARNGEGAVATMTEFLQPWVEGMNSALDTALTSGDFDLAKKIGEALQLDPADLQTAIDDAKAKISEAFAPKQRTGGLFDMSGVAGGNPLEAAFNKTIDTSGIDAVTKSATDASTATDGVQTSWDNLSVNLATPVGAVVTQIGSVSTAASDMDSSVANSLTGNTVTTSFETMAQSARQNAQIVLVAFNGMIMAAHDLDFVLGNILRRFEAVRVAATGFQNTPIPAAPTSGGGNTTTNNNNNSINVTVQPGNDTKEVGGAYRLASLIRGMT